MSGDGHPPEAYPLWQWYDSMHRLRFHVHHKARGLDNAIYRATHRETALFEHILLQTNNTCTRKCSFCWYGIPEVEITEHQMARELFDKIIEELVDLEFGGRLSLFEMNEPLTDPRIFDLVAHAKQRLPDVYHYMISNGDLLDEEKTVRLVEAGLDFLQISSYTPKAYKRTARILRRLPRHVREKILQRDSTDSSFASDNRGGNLPQIETRSDVSRDPCMRIHHVLYIKPEGTAVSCFGDYFNVNVMGDANHQTVEEIWFGEPFETLRRNLNAGNREVSEICKKCNLGTRRVFASRRSLARTLAKATPLVGAIVGASSSAKMFLPALSAASAPTTLVTRVEDPGPVFDTYDLAKISDLGDVLQESVLDYVFVANTNAEHYRSCRAALEAEKHVLAEKPITLDLDELDHLVELAAEKDLVLGGVFQWRFLSCLRVVRDLVQSGALGDLLFLNGRVVWHRGESYFQRGRGSWEDDGGGVLVKQAIHALDLLLHLGGEVRDVQATATQAEETGTEDSIQVLLQFAGASGSLLATRSYHRDLPAEIEVIGSQGRIAFDTRDRWTSWDVPGRPQPPVSPTDLCAAQVQNFLEAVRGREDLEVTAKDCRRSLDVVLRAYRAAGLISPRGD